MRVLHIMDQEITGKVLNGGQYGAKKNFEILGSIFGSENIYLLMFCKVNRPSEEERVFKLPIVKNGFIEIIFSFMGYRRFIPKYKKDIVKIIEKVNPDIVFLDSSKIGIITKWIKKDIRCIVHFHNVEVDYIWKNKIKQKKYYAIPTVLSTYYNEKCAVTRADEILCINDRDSKRVQQLYKRKADMILPVCFEDKYNEKLLRRNVDDKCIIFIGSYFPPNYHGIKWLVERVMPELEEFKLLIIGRGFEEKKEELESPNIKVIGTVDNLEDYYYRYCSVVMPILYGDGMKVKTAEAMMYGMNIFATSEALEGYEAHNVDGIYECNSKEEFVEKIREAYNNRKINRCCEEVRKSFLNNNEFKSQIRMVREMIGK